MRVEAQPRARQTAGITGMSRSCGAAQGWSSHDRECRRRNSVFGKEQREAQNSGRQWVKVTPMSAPGAVDISNVGERRMFSSRFLWLARHLAVGPGKRQCKTSYLKQD